MTAILALATASGALPADPSISRMLGRMHARGSDRVESWRGRDVALGVSRYDWENWTGLGGRERGEGQGGGGLVVAADATLYYRGELGRRLASAGVGPAGQSASDLIAAAYRAWGERCVEHLEGDYAFALWDADRRRIFCARDFMGTRPLYYATPGASFIAASTVGAVLEHPEVREELDLVAIGNTVAALFASVDRTCYAGVSGLPAGHTLTWHVGDLAVRVARFWNAPVFLSEETPTVPFEAAREELRDLLIQATAERLDTGATSISLSGGYDSPAIFGAAQPALREQGGARLLPISISYPPGDLGREDELIRVIADYWNAETRWIDIRDVPMFAGAQERAGERDEPFCHGFENFNRSLARAGRDLGTKVMLNGNGGDQLFHVEPVYLADLLRRGRLPSVMREWRATGVNSYRELFRWAVLPLMGPRSKGLAARVRGGRPIHGYLDQIVPTWVRPDFAERNHLLERELEHAPKPEGQDAASFERTWILSHPFYGRINAEQFAISLEEGVEQRAPLYDARIVRFAATRPRSERRSRNETKRLLRAAVSDLLPPEVLAPRTYRTGTTVTYFGRSMREALTSIGPQVFAAPVLAELGIVDPRALEAAVAAYLRGDAEATGPSLLYTLQTELWLRSRTGARQDTGLGGPVKELVVA